MGGGSNPDKCRHFFKTLITSQNRVNAIVSCANLYPSIKKKLAPELKSNWCYKHLSGVCSACVFCVQEGIIFSSPQQHSSLCVNLTANIRWIYARGFNPRHLSNTLLEYCRRSDFRGTLVNVVKETYTVHLSIFKRILRKINWNMCKSWK